jgi:hypothetical protein
MILDIMILAAMVPVIMSLNLTQNEKSFQLLMCDTNEQESEIYLTLSFQQTEINLSY